MQKEEIFQRVINKALLGGWKPKGLLKGCLDGTIATGMETNFYKFILDSDDNAWYGYIFDIDFAKALWGEGVHSVESVGMHSFKCCNCGSDELHLTYETCYETHLKRLVVCKNKLEYLEKFI